MTREEAVTLTNDIAFDLDVAHDKLIKAWSEEAWRTMGYGSWDAYCEGEFGDKLAALSREARREYAGRLLDDGMSSRDAAAVLGVSHMTVSRDREESRPVTDVTPNEQSVIGRDGKVYKARQPKAEPWDEFKISDENAEKMTGDEAHLLNSVAALFYGFTRTDYAETFSSEARRILIDRLEDLLAVLKETA